MTQSLRLKEKLYSLKIPEDIFKNALRKYIWNRGAQYILRKGGGLYKRWGFISFTDNSFRPYQIWVFLGRNGQIWNRVYRYETFFIFKQFIYHHISRLIIVQAWIPGKNIEFCEYSVDFGRKGKKLQDFIPVG